MHIHKHYHTCVTLVSYKENRRNMSLIYIGSTLDARYVSTNYISTKYVGFKINIKYLK